MQIRYVLALTLICSMFLVLPAAFSELVLVPSHQVNQFETTTVASTVITSQAQLQLLLNRNFKVISTTGTNRPCEAYNFTFTAAQGRYVFGNFSSIIPLYFYIVQDSAFQAWLSSGSCGNASDAVVSLANAMSYSFNVALPSSGAWDIVLVNYSNSRDATGFITAYLSAGSYTLTQPVLSTITAATSSTSFSSSYTQTYPGIAGFSIESIIIGTLIGASALIVLRRQRNHAG